MLAGGYVVGSHLAGMMGGMHTELVFNAANAEDRGVRVGIVEEGRLVEMWHEHSAGPGEGMRVGDVYLGVVAKVISGMQGVLVDVTGQGPPYSLMQKGVDEPALAWCHATREDLREMEEAESAAKRANATSARERDAAEATPAEVAAATRETEEQAEERKWARLERRARALNGAAAGVGGRRRGRTASVPGTIINPRPRASSTSTQPSTNPTTKPTWKAERTRTKTRMRTWARTWAIRTSARAIRIRIRIRRGGEDGVAATTTKTTRTRTRTTRTVPDPKNRIAIAMAAASANIWGGRLGRCTSSARVATRVSPGEIASSSIGARACPWWCR